MKMSDNNRILERAKSFLYKNGRLIDRKRFEFLFENGTKEAVIGALRAYQNPDGGFGHALEPDIRCPYSQPVPTEMALMLMEEIDCYDPDLLGGIIRYVRGITLPEGGVPFVFCNAKDYPHAPWWGAERDDVASVNPTGLLMGQLSKQTARTDILQEEWFQRNTAYLWRVFEQERPAGYHDGIQWITFLQHTSEPEKAEAYLARIDEWLQQPGIIERDPNAAGYVHKVLDWAPHRDSYAGRVIPQADIQRHLDALIDQQQEDGGWSISWEAVGPGAEAEWRGYLTVERLKTLKSYGVI
ncbi:prenyltransferase/squalene oxidase repeat-containing protein [Paenibacillus silvisoli]|uniref:prenyltransferase/squalene oxidase repeat-containing protein n=1 Tax=Paenibacillus silvisoli TaxID=3110539 RepID=UPI0028052052|nr:prenyltransferase/squalene oxidase repeat-containing protein [Paenibacillus silvisoli]